MKPVIVCIAKLESNYIEEFVKYHLALGFSTIYIYDNEDSPTYQELLRAYANNIKVIHMPHNNYHKAVQYVALDHFVKHFMYTNGITHVAHIDIDEFIVLKKHENICGFIKKYIVGDCAGIGMNWRFFGSSGQTSYTNAPVTMRFTMCENNCNQHIKTIFKVSEFISYNTCHDVNVKKSQNINSTDGRIINGPFNPNGDISVIQLNHYKCKTLEEFKYMRTRQRADVKGQVNHINDDIDSTFNAFNINEVVDETASNFYAKIM
jgi:hypothetical protein